MRIFNADKTQELNESKLDFEKGYLKSDKLSVHYEAVEGKPAVYKDRVVKYKNGSTSIFKDLVSPEVRSKNAYDEYEDIKVYVPYTEEELNDMLRAKRKNLLNAFDKWEKAVLRGRELDDQDIMQWYQDILDLKKFAFKDIPQRIQYYL